RKFEQAIGRGRRVRLQITDQSVIKLMTERSTVRCLGAVSREKGRQAMAIAAVRRTPKFRRRAEARPDEVLDAALDLFIENGFAATRVDDIAKRAGLSKGAVYLYFPSKEAIIEALVRRALVPV